MREKSIFRNALRMGFCLLILLYGSPSFSAEFSFDPSIEVNAMYSENIFYLDSYKAGDYIIALTTNLPLEFSSPSKKLTLLYAPKAEFYKEYNNRNYVGHYFRSFYEYEGKKSRLRISELFSKTEGQGEIIDVENVPAGFLTRTDILTNQFAIFYALQMSRRAFLNFTVSHDLSRYEDLYDTENDLGPDVLFENTETFSAMIDNLFALENRRSRVGYFYNFKRLSFETLEGNETDSLGFVYQFDHPEKISLIVRAGMYALRKKVSLQGEDDASAIFSLDLSRNFNRGTVRFSASRDAGVRGGFGGISLNHRYVLGFSYDVTRRSSFTVSSEYYTREPIGENAISYDIIAVNETFDFKISRKITLSVHHRYFKQDSEDGTYNSQYSVFSVGSKVSF